MSREMRADSVAPISAVIPTRDRSPVLARMLDSLLDQETVPRELIIVDASCDNSTQELLNSCTGKLAERGCEIVWRRAAKAGAAVQRNQGIASASQGVIAFFDDDILFEPGCLARLWQALHSDPRLGGVNAMIVNQRYHPPGGVSRMMFRIMAGRSQASYAGHLLGPAINLLPEDRAELPEVVPVEWLNTTCTLYRREALPEPPFPDFFTGYSMMEDVALSVCVGKSWKLANARTARIFHDSQPGLHKSDPVALARMELVNRHYVMTQVIERRRLPDYAKLALWELFQLSVCAVHRRVGLEFWQNLRGKWQALAILCVRRGRVRS